MTQTTAINIGDICHWRYKSQDLDRDSFSYWAKSCIAIAVEGKTLRDTYWSGCSDGCVWSHSEANNRLILTFIANFADLDKISESEAEYYAECDIVNLNHANSPKGNCYRRKGTSRDQQVMLDKLVYESEKAKSAIRSAQRDIERLAETRRLIECGADLKGIWI